jgi:hypothetical protein
MQYMQPIQHYNCSIDLVDTEALDVTQKSKLQILQLASVRVRREGPNPIHPTFFARKVRWTSCPLLINWQGSTVECGCDCIHNGRKQYKHAQGQSGEAYEH